MDYNNIKATKYRINFIDNTYQDYPIQPIITNGVATYTMSIYVPLDNVITNIQLKSEDGTVVYQTISGLSSLDNGKIYKITQDCYVE